MTALEDVVEPGIIRDLGVPLVFGELRFRLGGPTEEGAGVRLGGVAASGVLKVESV